MSSHLTVPTLVVALATVTQVALLWFTAAYVRRRGRNPTVLAFGGLVTGGLLWSAGELVRQLLGLPIGPGAVPMLIQVGVGLVPASFLLLALLFTGRERLVRRSTVAVLAVEPLVTIALAATNPAGLMWAPDGTLGPYHVAHALYSYVLILAGVALFARTLADDRRIYRAQTVAIVLGLLVPLAYNVLNVFALVPWAGPQGIPTPAAFTVWSVVVGYAAFRHRLLDLVPVARNSVIQHMRDGFLVVDDGGRVIDANPAARELLGSGDPVGRRARDLLGPAATVLASTETAEAELSRAVAGEDRHVTVTATPIDVGSAAATLVTLRDETERRRTERRFRRLIEHSSDVILVFADPETVTYASPSVETVLGWDPERLTDDGFRHAVAPTDRDVLDRALAEGMATPGETTRFELAAFTADGEARILEGVGRNRTDDPLIEGYVVNFRDVTERRRHERQLQRTNERLEEFAGVVAHDLDNPLQVIDASLRLAREEGDHSHLDRAIDATERMDELLTDLLTLARQGRTVDETEPVALESAAREAWETIETADLTLRVETDRVLEADPNRLRQLLENVFDNVATHASGATTVRVVDTEDGFAVLDDGAGFPTDDPAELFEHGHTTSEDGTGFGLSIVETIAGAHDWTVEAGESEDGGARIAFGNVGQRPRAAA